MFYYLQCKAITFECDHHRHQQLLLVYSSQWPKQEETFVLSSVLKGSNPPHHLPLRPSLSNHVIKNLISCLNGVDHHHRTNDLNWINGGLDFLLIPRINIITTILWNKKRMREGVMRHIHQILYVQKGALLPATGNRLLIDSVRRL